MPKPKVRQNIQGPIWIDTGRTQPEQISCLPQKADVTRSSWHISNVPRSDLGRARKAPARDTAQPPNESSNSYGSRGQQERGAKRDHRKSRPIRFDPKAASRSFRFQGVTGLPGAKP